jgi:hypothetical protein
MKFNRKHQELIKAFIEADCEKFAGLLQVYIKMIEGQIPFAGNPERAQGMADAVEILQGGVDKAREVAKMVLKGKHKELEDQMAKEALPRYLKQKAD